MPEPWTVSLRFLESLPTEDGRELPECILSCSMGCSSSRRVGRERDVKDRSQLPPPGAPQFVPKSPKESRTSSPRSPHTPKRGPRVPCCIAGVGESSSLDGSLNPTSFHTPDALAAELTHLSRLDKRLSAVLERGDAAL